MPASNDDLINFLNFIHGGVSASYPLGDDIDPRVAMTLGLILGAASEGLEAVDQNRKIRLERRLALSAEDFRALVNGGEVNRDGVRLILMDIGFPRMLTAIDEAITQRRAARGNDAR